MLRWQAIGPSDHTDIVINQRIECHLNNTIKSSLLNSTHYVMLYTQTGDRIVATDSVTSRHPMYTLCFPGFMDDVIFCK